MAADSLTAELAEVLVRKVMVFRTGELMPNGTSRTSRAHAFRIGKVPKSSSISILVKLSEKQNKPATKFLFVAGLIFSW